ncbi:MAG TPA: PPC domain-containing protein, partial [Myxococcaceae bacterium]|nr:PPC domain-containing protein [Myxococcaceae bacterium]
ISMLYNNGGMVYQTPDSDVFLKWTKDPTRKRARPYYPVYGTQYNVSSGAKLFPHHTLANCSLYTSASGGTTATTFYMNGFCEALPITPLTKNVTVSSLSDSAGGRKYYSISVPAGVSTLTFDTSGGTGDVDLYVRSGSSPTFSTFNCRPYAGGNNEVCTFSAPSPGTWYVMLHGWSSYSGVGLTARY